MKTQASLILAVGMFLGQMNSATAALHDRGDIVFDDVLNISWIKNANLAATNRFGLPSKAGGFESDTFATGVTLGGMMNWTTAEQWIEGMNAANYLGYADWRMPRTLQPDLSCSSQGGGRSSAFGCIGGEMGNLFYKTFGATVVVDPVTNNVIAFSPPSSTEPLINLQPSLYWSGTPYPPDSSHFFFSFSNGQQSDYQDGYVNMFVMAVRDGDSIPAVSEPSIAALTLASLPVLFVTYKRRRVSLRRAEELPV